MLSPENPPPDPPHEISQQLKSSSSDERASSDKVVLQEELVDLLNKSGSDDNNPPHKFSIRDYVFGARSKDIETNWPFSQKTLRLCQKHGVKNLLPPFQSLNAVTNQCFSICPVETSSVEVEGKRISNEEPSALNSPSVSVASGDIGCGKNLPLDCVNARVVPSKSDGDKQILSGFEKASPTKQKAENTNQSPVKKCKLIVKVGGNDPSGHSDSMVNSVAFPDTSMASKVCPVCKSFSSSSNTTLNAHIDQCLSVESPSNLNANSRVVRHRVKPRKTKLMVDIYPTAPHCTLEELDRRNGTSWAVNSNMPIEEETECAAEVEEEKEKSDEEELEDEVEPRASAVNSRVIKHRVKPRKTKKNFSSSSNTTLNAHIDQYLSDEEELEDEVEPRASAVNSSGKDEGAVYIDANGTKVRILSKFNDISPSVPKLKEDHGHLRAGKGCSRKKLITINKKKHHIRKHHKYLNLTLDARSKKFCSPMSQSTFEVEEEVQERNASSGENNWKEQSLVRPISCQDKTKVIDSGTITRWASSKRRALLRKRGCKEGLQHLSSNFRPIESDRTCFMDPTTKRTPNSYNHPLASPRLEDAPVKSASNDFVDQSSVRKRVGGGSFGPQHSGKIEKCLEPPKKKQLRKDGNSIGARFKDFASNTVYRVPSLAFDPAETSAGHDKHVPSLKASKFSSPRKHISVNQSSFFESKKSREVVSLSSENDSLEKHGENQSRLGPVTGKVCVGKRSALRIRKKRRRLGSPSSSEYNRDLGNEQDSSPRVGGDFADLSSDMVSGPSSGVDIVGNVASKSFDTELHKMNSPSNTTSGSLQSDVYKKRSLCGTETTLCPINRSFHDDQMFGEDEVGDVQRDFFTIPIPGPPGSFLPSPRNMGSEDVQGNSSLTVSRAHSSLDHHDLPDRYSSNSPISAKSAVSNSKCAESSSAGKSAMPSQRIISQEEEITTATFAETAPASFRNDQPCCCSRKESISRGSFLNYQDSQLLRRRAMASQPEGGLTFGSSLGSVQEKNVAPFSKSTVKAAADSAPKPPLGVSDSPSPSGSNPVLRLMGKNLMVVNKAETVTEQLKPAPQVSSNDKPDQLSQTPPSVFPGASDCDIQAFARHMNFSQNELNTFANYFNPRTPRTSAHASGINSFFGGLSGAGFEQHEYGQQVRYRNVEKYARASDGRQHENAVFAAKPMKEIIIIDDGPETEANEPNRGTMSNNSRAMMSGGFRAPTAANNHPCYVSPFYSFRPNDSSSHYFQMPPQSRAGGNPNKWNRSPGGSQVLPPSSLAGPSQSTSGLRPPPLYYTPNFS